MLVDVFERHKRCIEITIHKMWTVPVFFLATETENTKKTLSLQDKRTTIV